METRFSDSSAMERGRKDAIPPLVPHRIADSNIPDISP